jgi:transcriptional regulator with XRE-family HTH domain
LTNNDEIVMMRSMLMTQTGPSAVIAQERRDRGWTYDRMAFEVLRHPELGANFQISPRTIQRAERGQRPTVRVQFAIAHVLGMKPSQLWPADLKPTRRAVTA